MDYTRKRMRIGDILIEQGVISPEVLKDALVRAKEEGKRIGEYLVESGITNEKRIARALEYQLGYKFVDLSSVTIPEEILNLVKPEVLRKYHVIPFAVSERNPNILRLAMSDPMDIVAADDIGIVTNMQIEPVICTGTDVMAALDRYFGSSQAMDVAKCIRRSFSPRCGVWP